MISDVPGARRKDLVKRLINMDFLILNLFVSLLKIYSEGLREYPRKIWRGVVKHH